jgi:hypothetical protein
MKTGEVAISVELKKREENSDLPTGKNVSRSWILFLVKPLKSKGALQQWRSEVTDLLGDWIVRYLR